MSNNAAKKGNRKEVCHYVVTSHPPGAVHCSVKCNFTAPDSQDVIIAKSRRLEIRQLKAVDAEDAMVDGADFESNPDFFHSPFPVTFTVPINGRITVLKAFHVPTYPMAFLFILTDDDQYAVVSYDPTYTATDVGNPYPIRTLLSESLHGEAWNILGKAAECGPLVAVDPHNRCIVLHIFDGLLTVLPIAQTYVPPQSRAAGGGSYGRTKSDGGKLRTSSSASGSTVLEYPFHARIEEHTVLSLAMLHHFDSVSTPPHVCILHQDSRGAQHITTHCVDLSKNQMWFLTGQGGGSSSSAPPTCEWLKKSRIDGGSSLLIPVPPRMATPPPPVAGAPPASNEQYQSQPPGPCGGVVILGQRQITYCGHHHYKVMPIPPALLLSWDFLPSDVSGMPRFLLGDEFGNLHMLTLVTSEQQPQSVIALQLDALGSCTLSSQLTYLDQGLVFVGSEVGDSQLIQIHDEPIALMEDTLEEDEDGHMHPPVTASPEDDLDLGETTYLSVVEEYTHLGPIVDFDLFPTTPGASMSSNANAAMGASDAGAGGSDGKTGAESMESASTMPNQQQSQGYQQCQVVTASGCSKSGSLRVIRNGIGMNEYASVELSGIQNMWSLRPSFDATHHAYLVQSYVGETRVLGVSGGDAEEDGGENESKMDNSAGDAGEGEEEEEEAGGTLEEVQLPGLESDASTLYVGNVIGDLFLQITESQIRLASQVGEVLDIWNPPNEDEQIQPSPITVAAANEDGQMAIAQRGGVVFYLDVQDRSIQQIHKRQMDKEVSCMNLNPFASKKQGAAAEASTYARKDSAGDAMEVEGSNSPCRSEFLAVGLWDDFTVRLLSLEASLHELVNIHLDIEDEDEDHEDAAQKAIADMQRRNRNNMMARSLCLITLDFSASSSSSVAHKSKDSSSHHHQSAGVNMLLVGLGDGTLVSFALVQPEDGRPVRVQSRKEVSLGSQRINLIPLRTERGGTCVLATGDRPTVIYLAGISGTASSSSDNFNPKLCYSNVNLSTEENDGGAEGGDLGRPRGHKNIAVNVAAPFFSPLLFDQSMGTGHYSLCVADDSNLRLGVIDDIQKLHVTTCHLGMAPRRVAYCAEGRFFAVGCIESGIKHPGIGGADVNMANCVRFIDDTTFEDIEKIDLDPFEMIKSMEYVMLDVKDASAASGAGMESINTSGRRKYLLLGTAYGLPDEDEPTKGRILVISCCPDDGLDAVSKEIRIVTEFQVRGAVYSIGQFHGGRFLACINSKTQLFHLLSDGTASMRLAIVGVGHHGHTLSLQVKSRANDMLAPVRSGASGGADKTGDELGESKAEAPQTEQLAIVGDLVRSISLVEYYPEHNTVEEVARDFNANDTTAIEMLTDDVYLGAEAYNNLFVLKRNRAAQSDAMRCRLDTIGEFHLGEMCNKFMGGSLVMPQTSASNASGQGSGGGSGSTDGRNRRRSIASSKKTMESSQMSGGAQSATSRSRRPSVVVGSQTLFGTVDGTLGCILGLDGPTAAFFACLERSMQRTIKPIGGFSHQMFRAFSGEKRQYPSHGFVDGDMIEAFMDLDRLTMQKIVTYMNKDGGWEMDDVMMDYGSDKNGSASGDMMEDVRPALSVDDVLALVEEIAMLH